jgi:thymidylate synthase
VMNPLETLVEKIKKQLTHKSTLSRVYELNLTEVFSDLALYEATEDCNRGRNHPCLSHISVRIENKNMIALTALYRSHFYIQKTLGNLLGLAQLQSFIAEEANLGVGPLVIHSIHAELDSASRKYGKQDIRSLIERSKKAWETKAA